MVELTIDINSNLPIIYSPHTMEFYDILQQTAAVEDLVAEGQVHPEV